MKKLLIVMLGILIIGLAGSSYAQSNDEYAEAFNIFRKSPAVQKFFENSYGYALFPTIGKAGFIVGGSYGVGQVYQAGAVTGKSQVIEGSVGLQIGGKAYRQVIFFENKASYDRFTSGEFQFDTKAQATVVTAAAEAKAGTTGVTAGASALPTEGAQASTGYYLGMATFVQSIGGLMAEFSIAGQKYSFEPIKK